MTSNIANICFSPPIITEPSVLVAEFPTGVGEESSDQLHVFPLPARSQLTLRPPVMLTRISILTMDGRIVRERSIRSRNTIIDVQGLPAGIYLIRAADAEGNQMHHSFLIERN